MCSRKGEDSIPKDKQLENSLKEFEELAELLNETEVLVEMAEESEDDEFANEALENQKKFNQ